MAACRARFRMVCRRYQLRRSWPRRIGVFKSFFGACSGFVWTARRGRISCRRRGCRPSARCGGCQSRQSGRSCGPHLKNGGSSGLEARNAAPPSASFSRASLPSSGSGTPKKSSSATPSGPAPGLRVRVRDCCVVARPLFHALIHWQGAPLARGSRVRGGAAPARSSQTACVQLRPTGPAGASGELWLLL